MYSKEILDNDNSSTPTQPFVLIQIAFSLILIGTLIGISTNTINGLIGQEYFRVIMGWNFDGIWLAAIAQGALEGTIYGIVFSIIYTISFAFITKKRGDWNFAKSIILKTIPIVFISWAVIGSIAIFLALIFWDGYDQIIIGVPQDILKRIAYAWVGGSIWGGIIGAIIAIPYSLIITTQKWLEN